MTESPDTDDEPRIYKALKRLIVHRPLPEAEISPPAAPEKPWWLAAEEEDDSDPLGPGFTGGLGR